MSKTARFHSAVPRARPAGSRIIDAYSLKLDRCLQCFGKAVFEQWIRLEIHGAYLLNDRDVPEKPRLIDVLRLVARLA